MLQKGEIEVTPVSSKLIFKISSVRVHCPNDLRSKDSRKGLFKVVTEVKRRYPEGPPLLNPVIDMNIKDEDFKDICDKIDRLEKRYGYLFIINL